MQHSLEPVESRIDWGLPMRRFSRFYMRWKVRARARAHRGTVRTIPAVASPELGNRRNLLVYTPASYARGTARYPVIFMHDGQNLFDAATSFAGDWGLKTALAWASRRGLEAIVVGIPNMGAARIDEYTPFVDPKVGGGGGDRYLNYLINTVKPLGEGRLYFDVGLPEGDTHVRLARRLRDVLLAKGYEPQRDLRWVEDEAGRHHESAWGRRFRRALPFLLRNGGGGPR